MSGIFPQQSHSEEIAQLLRGDYKQFSVLPIDVNAAGFPASTNRGLFEIEGNGLIITPRILDKDLNERVSSVVARIYVRLNHEDNLWIPFSLINNGLDFCSVTATIARFWVRVVTNEAGKFLYLLVTKGATFSAAGTTGGASGGGYANVGGGFGK